MPEMLEKHEPFGEVEALVRAARGYVRASDDLRPRVLEAARLQRRERGTRRWMQFLACLVLMFAVLTIADRDELSARRSRTVGVVAAAGLDDFLSPSAIAAARGTDGDWWMFEAFTKLRRHQAQVLRLEI